ncbi:MAG: hypothetical protein CMJ18_01945 [Phycisphaeraceae bacterium]|nr:hypothetical protein [Phycisphaeraceae bacterium]
MILSEAMPPQQFRQFDRDAVERSIAGRFREQVAAHGSRNAIEVPGRSVTYAELERSANRVARALRERSETCDEPVAILADDPIRTVTCLLGALIAGKCYVPIDAHAPQHWQRAIVTECAASLLIAGGAALEAARGIATDAVHVVDADQAVGRRSGDPPAVTSSPDSLSCVLFTSGSTGRPKGVTQNHRNVLHQVRIRTNSARVTSDDRLTALASFSVGASLTNLFGALLNGATLCPFDARRRGPEELVRWLDDRRITIYHSVPTLFRRMAAAMAPDHRLNHLRLIRLGGEAVRASDIGLYRRHFAPGCVLNISYSTSETSTICQRFLDQDTPFADATPAVGTPAEDMEVVLTDEAGAPVAPGEVGEIVVRSRYLSPGYWRQPDLTARAFADGGDGPEPTRKYRTGDLGRWTDDGMLVHLGRSDSMVKVRGQRVEIAEVQGALSNLDMLRDAVVVPRADQDGESKLVAYVVPTDAGSVTVSGLRAEIARRLPDAMVPSAFIELESLPTGPGGKVDVESLPDPGTDRPTLDNRYVEPRTPTERTVEAIWSDVLGIDEIGADDDFFELGGHSLAAARMFDHIREQLGASMPLATLFRFPTVSALARAIDSDVAQSMSPLVVPIKPDGDRPPFFCVHGIGGEVLFLEPLARRLPPAQPLYGIRAMGTDDREPVDEHVPDMARRYVRALREVQPHGPYHLGGFSSGGSIAYEMAQQLTAAGEHVRFLAVFDQTPPNCGPQRPPWHPRSIGRFIYNLPLYLVDDIIRPVRPLHLRARVLGKLNLRRHREPDPTTALQALFRTDGLSNRRIDFLAAHLKAVRAYEPRPFDGRITIFRARTLPLFRPDPPERRWKSVARGGLDVHVTRGSHEGMFWEPWVRTLAGKLAECLARCSIDSSAVTSCRGDEKLKNHG